MTLRLTRVSLAAALLSTATRLAAQAHPPTPSAPVQASPAAPRGPDDETPKFDPAAVERGQQILVQRCGFCHGSNARGGAQGSDLIRSSLVQSDEGGQQLGEFLKVGRPERNMPAFNLLEQDLADLATFLHASIVSVSERGKYKILDILVGDPRKGERFFHGAGKCSSCHSPTGDLKGVASRLEDAVAIQQRLVMPRERRRGRGQPGKDETPPFLEPTAVKATVALASGESFTGALIRLTDFDVTLYDADRQEPRTWLRRDGSPTVTISDPLQAHVDLWRKWTDDDIHNMTAYLATLK